MIIMIINIIVMSSSHILVCTMYFFIVQLCAIVTRSINATCLLCLFSSSNILWQFTQ